MFVLAHKIISAIKSKFGDWDTPYPHWGTLKVSSEMKIKWMCYALCHRSFPNPNIAAREVLFHVSFYISLPHQNMMSFKLVSWRLGGFCLSLGVWNYPGWLSILPSNHTIPDIKKVVFPKNESYGHYLSYATLATNVALLVAILSVTVQGHF